MLIIAEDPSLHFYEATVLSESVDYSLVWNITPLFLAGDMATASPLVPDYSQWALSAGWSGVLPISVDGPHWNVEITGLVPTSGAGNFICVEYYNDHYQTWYSDYLQVNVIPEPTTIALLAVGALALLRKQH